MSRPNQSFWLGKKVLVTGHTGFKGAWLSQALTMMGAKVGGVALKPSTDPSLFSLMGLEKSLVAHQLLDIRDHKELDLFVSDFQPEVVFHMAAQALVRPSYEDPKGTYETNVIGSLNVLESCRRLKKLRSLIVVTSDKCYENFEWLWRYRENDPMGGYDPYSSSKACTEILAQSYRRSFFQPAQIGLATVRAGNVIGGGDWSEARLVPDVVRAVKNLETLSIRYPDSIRPWQHVLDPLRGYILLAERLFEDPSGEWASAWNFGPSAENERPVAELVSSAKKYFPELVVEETSSEAHPHEAKYLALDSSKALRALGWAPALPLQEALGLTWAWYRNWISGEDVQLFTEQQISEQIL